MCKTLELALRGPTERLAIGKASPAKCCEALNVHLSWQLQWDFKMKILNMVGSFVEYWLALALTILHDNLGNLDSVSKCVHVGNPLVAVALKVFGLGNIVEYTQDITEKTTSTSI
jgi:hypothetical protein